MARAALSASLGWSALRSDNESACCGRQFLKCRGHCTDHAPKSLHPAVESKARSCCCHTRMQQEHKQTAAAALCNASKHILYCHVQGSTPAVHRHTHRVTRESCARHAFTWPHAKLLRSLPHLPQSQTNRLAQQGHCHCWYTSNTHIDTHTYPGSVVCCLLGEKQAQIEGRPRPVSSAWLHMCMWRRHSSMPAQLAAARHTAARERHLPGTRSVHSSAASRICTEACTPTVQSHLPRKSTCLPARPPAGHHAHTAQ